MDAITDPTFQPTKSRTTVTEDAPSLLTVVIDTDPKLWLRLDKETGEEDNLLKTVRAITVFLNAHLAFNTANQVAVIAAHSQGIKYLFPRSSDHQKANNGSGIPQPSDTKQSQSIISSGMYRRFSNVDETLVEEISKLLKEEEELGASIDAEENHKSTLPGAMSAALAYTNRILRELETIALKSRLMVVTCNNHDKKEEIFQYIPIMNCIFSATKIKCPIDVVKIGGSKESTFLQQTTDATGGVYLHVESTKGLIQYLSTAMFIDPSLRQIIVKPNHGSVDFRTSCYLTGKIVAVGFICSVCLCVLSIIPPGNKCPACDSEFDERVIAKFKKKPVVPRLNKQKKRVTKP